MNSEIFKIDFGGHFLVGDFIGKELPNQVFMLHGAGGAHRGKMLPLRKELCQKGIGSCAFDFIGHGDTGGDLRRTSLALRTEQARTVIEELGLARKRPLNLLAASMGGHIACRLLEHYSIDRLIFVVPAMYNRSAYRVSFDEGFSDVIRRPMSFRDSEGWDLLRTFTGQVLIIAAEKDVVIPQEVIELYYSSSQAASKRRIYIAPGVGHMVFTELREKNKPEMGRIVDLIAREFETRID